MSKPVLLIHGLFGCLNEPRILSSFGDRTVFAPDLLGYGTTQLTANVEPSLEMQADHVVHWLDGTYKGPVDVVGHSIGGAVAVVFASKYPQHVSSLTSVEGNFTLKDAFWSSQIAKKDVSEVEQLIQGYKADVAGWLRSSVPSPTDWALSVAMQWLDHQPAATICAQARAVVSATAKPEYLDRVREILEAKIPFHLVAGERSRAGWDVPDWLAKAATTNNDIPNTGHLMMLEAAEEFAGAICQNF
jgi:pimeloyl-ACP methyl ester carboxylesterase